MKTSILSSLFYNNTHVEVIIPLLDDLRFLILNFFIFSQITNINIYDIHKYKLILRKQKPLLNPIFRFQKPNNHRETRPIRMFKIRR